MTEVPSVVTYAVPREPPTQRAHSPASEACADGMPCGYQTALDLLGLNLKMYNVLLVFYDGNQC